MSRSRHVRLPALKIPSDPPKFRYVKPKTIAELIDSQTGEKGPTPSTTSCEKKESEPHIDPGLVNLNSPQVAPETSDDLQQPTKERFLPPIHKEPVDSRIPGLYGAYYSQCVCDKRANFDPLNEVPPHTNGAVGKSSATQLLGGQFEQPVKYKHFAYGSNDWLHLLVTGQLPPEVLQAFMSKFSRAGQTLKAYGPTADKYFQYQSRRKRTKELWEPKEMKQQQIHSQFDRVQLEASCRQRKKMADLSKKAEKMVKRNESVLLKKVDKVDNRVKSYLDKLEKNCHSGRLSTNKNSNGRRTSSRSSIGNRLQQTVEQV